LQFCPQCGEPARQGVAAASQEPHYRWMEDGGGRPGGSSDPRATPPPAPAQHRPHQGQQPAQQWTPPPAQPYSQPAYQYQPQPPQSYPSSTQHVVHHHEVLQQPGGAPSAAMGIGITALCFMILGLVPCLGWLNYFTILLGVFSGTFSLICMFVPKFAGARGKLVIGLIFGFVACFIGFIRLVLGGGCF
jgi:hypothetical protein